MEFIQAKDWIGTDYRNYNRGNNPITGKVVDGDRTTDPAFNGVNVYGDETLLPFRSVLQQVGAGFIAAGAAPAAAVNGIIGTVATGQSVTRTGYMEKDVIDPTTLNVKLSGSVNYKLTEQIEASLAAFWGTGNTVYTGSDRYSLKSLKMGQYKFELRSNRWFARAYTTQENAGESFNASATTALFNEAVKPSQTWIVQYTTQYLTSRLQGANDMNAHNAARSVADAGRPTGFIGNNPLFQKVAATPIPKGGLFLDKSDLYVAEGQYNLTDIFNLQLDDNKTEVLVGGSFKRYVLNSQGTLFADTAGRIGINEVGTYLQVIQKLFQNRLRLTASGRYDKNENFKGRFTPRFSAVAEVAKDHHVRLSYQTAYRFPSTQNQWINLTIGGGVQLIGGLPQLREFHKFNTNPVYTPESVAAFGASGNPALLVQRAFGDYKPESSKSYEIGYKGLVGKKLLIDVYGYFAKYQDFLGRTVVLQSSNGNPTGLATPKIYSVAINATGEVDTRGWGASTEYLLPNNYSFGANVYSDVIDNVPSGFISAFNTPKYRANLVLSNSGMFKDKRFGFNLTYRYQDGMYFQGDFGSGDIPPVNILDGQVNYKFPAIKSMIKLGATNMLNKYYRSAFGNPEIGGLYYLSFGYNVF
jgi:outer membrane receptor protein involved in Fe transport